MLTKVCTAAMSYINLPTVLPSSPSKTRGQIQVILGPMFSGKSTELMRRVRRFQIAQYKCLVIKYAKDTRYSNSFSTHDRNTMDALPACMLRDVTQESLGVAVIGIDEGQFFPDIVDFCEMMANEGKTVIVAALDGTFQRKVKMSDSGLAEDPEAGNNIQGLPRSRCVQNRSYWLVGALNWPKGREQEGVALKKAGSVKYDVA